MSNEVAINDSFLFYKSESGNINIIVILDTKNETVWLNGQQIAALFGKDYSNILKHIKNIYNDEELSIDTTMAKFATVVSRGFRGEVEENIEYYNLDMIIAVGYRVSSYKATQFRIWATKVLREYLVKGFAMDDERLKQGKELFGKDYFEELLERIRGIRASERMFYKKVTDLFIETSYDYDKNSPEAKLFFAYAQNKLEYSVVGKTAAEIEKTRADYKLPNMGLMTWKGQKKGLKIIQSDTTVALNYLKLEEIKELNKLVTMFLDHAETLASKGKKMSMQDWTDKLDSFLKFNEYEVLKNYGTITKKLADKFAKEQFKKFKPIQNKLYKSDFDKVVETIKTTNKLPKETTKKKKEKPSKFNKSLKQAVGYNPNEDK
ncbi:RhuM family protein [Pseudomonadota bacterium]